MRSCFTASFAVLATAVLLSVPSVVYGAFPVEESAVSFTSWYTGGAHSVTVNATEDFVYIGTAAGLVRIDGTNPAVTSSYTTFNYPGGTTKIFTHVYGSSDIRNDCFFISAFYQHVILRFDIALGTLQHMAGTYNTGGTASGTGVNAQFFAPVHLNVNTANDRVFTADYDTHTVRMMVADSTTPLGGGVVSMLAGTPGSLGLVDHTDSTQVKFNRPFGVVYTTVNAVEVLFIGDFGGLAIRRVDVATGATITIGGAGTYQAGTDSAIRGGSAYSLCVRNEESIFVATYAAATTDSHLSILSWNADATSYHLDDVDTGSLARIRGIAMPSPSNPGRLYVTSQDTGVYLTNVTANNVIPTTTATPPTTTAAPIVATAVPPTIPQPPSVCTCPSRLTVDYDNTIVPDAGKQAYTTIALNTNTWDVEFKVHDVLSISNGHVLAASVDARQSAVATAITPLVASYDAAALWNSPSCGISGMDEPAASLGVAQAFIQDNCTRSYTITYSLTDAAQRTAHCQLSNTADNEVLVECELKISSIRAYDATSSSAFLTKETVFRANMTMPRNLPNEVSTLLHASLAKCSVYAAPDFYVDCRIPALWNFAPTFAVTQSPDWIIGSSCTQSNGTDATFVRCDLQSLSQIYTEATATIAATVLPSNEVMHFAVNYSLPREETASASGSLATFVKSIGAKDGKFFYGNDDLLTLEIEVVDTSRLQITQLELFNSDSPVQSYDLRTNTEFETVETQNATHFVIAFYPARKIDDSSFYRYGPHGVNVSFLFTAARRQQAGDTGAVTYKGIALKAPNAASKKSQQNGAPTTEGLSTTVIAGVAAGALVAVIAVVAAAVILLRKSSSAKKMHPQQPAKGGAVQEMEEVPTVVELEHIDANEV